MASPFECRYNAGSDSWPRVNPLLHPKYREFLNMAGSGYTLWTEPAFTCELIRRLTRMALYVLYASDGDKHTLVDLGGAIHRYCERLFKEPIQAGFAHLGDHPSIRRQKNYILDLGLRLSIAVVQYQHMTNEDVAKETLEELLVFMDVMYIHRPIPIPVPFSLQLAFPVNSPSSGSDGSGPSGGMPGPYRVAGDDGQS